MAEAQRAFARPRGKKRLVYRALESEVSVPALDLSALHGKVPSWCYTTSFPPIQCSLYRREQMNRTTAESDWNKVLPGSVFGSPGGAYVHGKCRLDACVRTFAQH